MQALDHCALSFISELHDAGGEGGGDAEGCVHAFAVEAVHFPRRRRSSEGAGEAGRVEAAWFGGVKRRRADAHEDFEADDDRLQQCATAGAPLLRRCKRGRHNDGARMNARPRLAQGVKFERMGEKPIGEGRLFGCKAHVGHADQPAWSHSLARLRNGDLAPLRGSSAYGDGECVD